MKRINFVIKLLDSFIYFLESVYKHIYVYVFLSAISFEHLLFLDNQHEVILFFFTTESPHALEITDDSSLGTVAELHLLLASLEVHVIHNCDQEVQDNHKVDEGGHDEHNPSKGRLGATELLKAVSIELTSSSEVGVHERIVPLFDESSIVRVVSTSARHHWAVEDLGLVILLGQSSVFNKGVRDGVERICKGSNQDQE